MDFRSDAKEAAWRAEVRQFLTAAGGSFPIDRCAESGRDRSALMRWRRDLGARGWILSLRVATRQAAGLVPNYEASIAKLYSWLLAQGILSTSVRALGPMGHLSSGPAGRARWTDASVLATQAANRQRGRAARAASNATSSRPEGSACPVSDFANQEDRKEMTHVYHHR